MNRRQLLIAGGISFLGSRLVFANRATERADIVVIGSGGAGFASAITAFDAGAKVIVLEKMPITGGNSQLAAGGMNAAGTSIQKKMGIPDDWKTMFEDTMKGGQNTNDPALVEILAKNSAESVEYMLSLGADLTDISRAGGAAHSRTHLPKGGSAVGFNIIHALRQNAIKRKMDVRTGSRAKALLQDKEGRIAGVMVSDRIGSLYTIEAPVVILASGGFSNSPELIRKYRPELASFWNTNQPGATGDGLMLAIALGAEVRDLDKIQVHPTQAANSKILISESVRGGGAILVNKDGQRFINELLTRDKVSQAELKQPDGVGILVFGEGTRNKLKLIRGYEHLELVKQASNIEALAEQVGVNGKALAKTVAAYNDYQKVKKDDAFDRPDMPYPIDTPTLYAIPVRPGIHYTMGGVVFNTKTQVLRKDGWIMGFFGAGEVTGGVHGSNRLGGNSISETITFGRIAGTQAAEYAKAVRKV
ncbi:MAG: flavocytochrome c [Burkholderiales bacterium]|jgi:fumarate reductase flavoprotein subunit|nr:flavocytochrome c [Burkholderiales bacterium]